MTHFPYKSGSRENPQNRVSLRAFDYSFGTPLGPGGKPPSGRTGGKGPAVFGGHGKGPGPPSWVRDSEYKQRRWPMVDTALDEILALREVVQTAQSMRAVFMPKPQRTSPAPWL